MIKYHDIISGLKQGKVFPLYLLFGEEELLIQEVVDLIIEKVVDPSARDFNFNTLYCKETSAGELVNLCQTLPLLSERRLVVAKEIEAFKSADLDVLVSYLNDPSPSTCLVMLSNQAKFEKKTVLAAVEAHGAAARFYAFQEREVLSWIDSWARQRGLTMQRDAALFLLQVTGNDLRKINNELEKVVIYLKEKKAITFEDVKTIAGDFREYSTFDLADAIGSRDREKALVILFRLMQEGESPVALLGSISWNFRRLVKAKTLEASGLSPDDITRRLGVIFHQAPLFKRQMQRYRIEEFPGVFGMLLSADKALKSSGISGRLVLERMILRLCQSG